MIHASKFDYDDKQRTHNLTITTREMGKLNTHRAQYNAWRIIEGIDFIIYILGDVRLYFKQYARYIYITIRFPYEPA